MKIIEKFIVNARNNGFIVETQDLKPMNFTEADYGISETGSLVFLFFDDKPQKPFFLEPVVNVLLHKEKVLGNYLDLFEKLKGVNFNEILIVSGPSQTADIEKILVQGVHGPKKIKIFIT